MEIKKVIGVIICVAFCFYEISGTSFISASKIEMSGDTWKYDFALKTLVFVGNQSIDGNASLDGHSTEPKWYKFANKTEHLIIGEGVTGIGKGAFYGFKKLESVDMADTVTRIDTWAFHDCINLKKINFSNSLKRIEDGALSGCWSLKKIELPNQIQSIGTFSECTKLKKVIIPQSVHKILPKTFMNCVSLTSVRLPVGLKKIDKKLFKNCKILKSVNIPSTVEIVYMSAFSGTGIRKISLNENVTQIKNGTYSGEKVFKKYDTDDYETKNLRLIEIKSKEVKSIAKGSFSGLSSKVVIKVPKSRKKKYTKMLRKSGLEKKVKIRTL